jgi:hypothetical protein
MAKPRSSFADEYNWFKNNMMRKSEIKGSSVSNSLQMEGGMQS